MWNQGVVIESISKSILTAPWKCFRWGQASRRAAFRPGRVGQSAPELFIRSYTVKANHAPKAASFPNTIQDGQTTWSAKGLACQRFLVPVLVFLRCTCFCWYSIHVFTWNFMRSRDLIAFWCCLFTSCSIPKDKKTRWISYAKQKTKMNVSSLSSSSTPTSHHIRC